MKKILCISLVILASCIPALSFATENPECNEIISYTPDKYIQTIRETGIEFSLYTEKDFEIVLRHAQAYCCYGAATSALLGKELCKNIKEGDRIYAQSPLLIDHLWNIGMRKLDGEEDHCKSFGIDCEMRTGDTTAAIRWREQINEVAESRKGYPPAYLDGLFRKMRGDRQGMIDDKIGERNLLSNRYVQMCEESLAVRDAVISLAPGGKGLSREASIGGYRTLCNDMITRRYLQEAKYIRTHMVEKGIQYLTDNLRNYIFDYMTKNRMSALADKYTMMDACFTSVLKTVTNTSCCNE